MTPGSVGALPGEGVLRLAEGRIRGA